MARVQTIQYYKCWVKKKRETAANSQILKHQEAMAALGCRTAGTMDSGRLREPLPRQPLERRKPVGTKCSSLLIFLFYSLLTGAVGEELSCKSNVLQPLAGSAARCGEWMGCWRPVLGAKRLDEEEVLEYILVYGSI